MISIVELVACCGSSASSPALPGQQPAPRRRVGLRAIRCRRRRWKPTLMSISEDVFVAEKEAAERPMLRWRRCIFNKIMSVSSTKNRRSLSFDHDDGCRSSVSLSTIMPAFSPAPFMF